MRLALIIIGTFSITALLVGLLLHFVVVPAILRLFQEEPDSNAALVRGIRQGQLD